MKYVYTQAAKEALSPLCLSGTEGDRNAFLYELLPDLLVERMQSSTNSDSPTYTQIAGRRIDLLLHPIETPEGRAVHVRLASETGA